MSNVVLTQASRWLHLTTVLGEDAVLPEDMEGVEEISQPFRFEIAALTTQAVTASQLLGTDATLSVSRFGTKTRHISGIVTALAQGGATRDGYRRLRLRIEPSLTILSHSSNYRIFQEKTVVDIATAILSARSVTNFRFDIVGTKTPRPYCVQFGETDLAFVSRLFDEEGYFFFFEHTASAHTLVVTDSETKYPAGPLDTFTFLADPHGVGQGVVSSLLLEKQLVDMKSVFRQFDFEAPDSPIDGTRATSLSFTSKSGWEHFRYGQGTALAARQTALANADVDASDRDFETLAGTSPAPELVSGHSFTLASTEHADVKLTNGTKDSIDGESFVPVRVTHAARDPSYFNRHPKEERRPFYRAEFAAIPAARPYRPRFRLPKPLAYGPQTATVVGPSGEEIYTDAHGRIRVQFHWDREGTKDENSSCFIRVAQSWAGKSWGMQFIPRIGMEVVVHFLDADPDQPLVTGVLYNGVNTPPFTLPANATISGLRTRSSKTGGTEDFNELSFEDKKDSELVYFHAQKDFTRKVENDDKLDVLHDQTRTVKNDRTTTISEGNEVFTIDKGNRTETISKGNETLTISEGNRAVDIKKGGDTLTLDVGDLSITLKSGNMSTELTKGNLSTTLTKGNLTQTCSTGSVTIEAMQGITLKCGSSTIELTAQGVTIKGGMVTAQATGKAELSGLMVDVKGSGMTKINGGLVKIN